VVLGRIMSNFINRAWLVLAMLVSCVSLAELASADPVGLSRANIEKIISSLGIQKRSVNGVRRSEDGSRMYIVFDDPVSEIVEVGPRSSSKILRTPGSLATIGNDGDFKSWFTPNSNNLNFATGEVIAGVQDMDMDPSGTYFVAGTSSGTIIAATEHPSNIIATSKLSRGIRIFFQPGRIYVFGLKSCDGCRPLGLGCEIYSFDKSRWSLEREIELKDFTALLDFDTSRGSVLAVTRGDLFPSLRIIDLATMRSRRFGFGREFGLFLNFDPRKASGHAEFESHPMQSKTPPI